MTAGFRNRRVGWNGGFIGDRMRLHPFIGRDADIQVSKSGIGGGSCGVRMIITFLVKINTNVNLFNGRVRIADQSGFGMMIVWLKGGPQCGSYKTFMRERRAERDWG